MICIGINKPISKISADDSLTVMASAFDAKSTNGATYKVDTVTATDTSTIDIPCFAFDQTTDQSIQILLQNTYTFVTGSAFRLRLKLRSEAQGDANKDCIFGVYGRIINADPDVSLGTSGSATTTLTTVGNVYISDWIDVTAAGTIAADSLIAIDIFRDADNVADTVDALLQLISVEFQFNQ